MKPFQDTAIRFDGKNLEVLDQRLLPDAETWIRIQNPNDMITAIQTLAVRGAPLIGVAAALALAHFHKNGANESATREAGLALRKSRPTAVNLMWAMDRMLKNLELGTEALLATADAIYQEEVASSAAMGRFGAELIRNGENILTHCNTGGLATVGIGTALGVVRTAQEQQKNIHVYVDETRPLLQGGRLTTWELEKAGIPYTLICDNMAASLMRAGKISRVLVGADRVAVNGDFANKIGTYSVAVAAKYHEVPFHPVAPISTVDFDCASGAQIPIEERKPEEVRGLVHPRAVRWSPEAARVWNPSFDVTPVELVTALVLDKGVFPREALQSGALKNLNE